MGISCDPDIEYWKIMNEDYFLILASDGVWDVMNSAETIGYVIREYLLKHILLYFIGHKISKKQ